MRTTLATILSSVVLLLMLASAPIATAAGLAAESDGRRVLIGDDSTRHVAIVDAKGHIEWEYRTVAIHDLHRLANGNVLMQTDWQHVVEVSPDKQVVWSYDSSKMNGNAGKGVEVHAFQRLPNGLTMIAESGIGRIIEVDKAGRIQHEVKLKVAHPSPHRDTRLVRKLASGNYLVCHEGDGVVREYDPKGHVVWEYPVPLFDKQPRGGHGPEAWGNQAFCALRLPSGNTLISTGNGHGVIEVTPDKQIVWHLKQNDLPGIQLAWVTTLQVLPNGHIVLGNCHAGPANPQIIEITRDKQVVWSFHDFKQFGNSMPNSQVIDGKDAGLR